MEKARSIVLEFDGTNDEQIVDRLHSLLWVNDKEIDEEVTEFLTEMQNDIIESTLYGYSGYSYEKLREKAEQLTEMIAEMQSWNWKKGKG